MNLDSKDLCLEKWSWQKSASQESIVVGEGIEGVSLVWVLGLR